MDGVEADFVWCKICEKHPEGFDTPATVDYNRKQRYRESLQLSINRKGTVRMKPGLLLVYAVLGLILLVVGWGVLKKHSVYPSTQVGYHVEDAGKSREAWEFANRIAGTLSLVCGGVVWLMMAVLWLVKAPFGVCLGIFFALAIVAVGTVIVVPLTLLRKK